MEIQFKNKNIKLEEKGNNNLIPNLSQYII